MATGEKTNNRAIGTDKDGEDLLNLTEILAEKGFLNGIITTDFVTGATPSSFFAHVIERDDSEAILEDLNESKVNFFMAAGASDFGKIKDEFIQKDISEFNDLQGRTAVFLSEESLGDVEDRGNQFPVHVQKALQNLEQQDLSQLRKALPASCPVIAVNKAKDIHTSTLKRNRHLVWILSQLRKALPASCPVIAVNKAKDIQIGRAHV